MISRVDLGGRADSIFVSRDNPALERDKGTLAGFVLVSLSVSRFFNPDFQGLKYFFFMSVSELKFCINI